LFKLKDENKTIVVLNVGSDKVHLEVRSPLNNAYQMFRQEVKEFVDNMGGHEKAFGAVLGKHVVKDVVDRIERIFG